MRRRTEEELEGRQRSDGRTDDIQWIVVTIAYGTFQHEIHLMRSQSKDTEKKRFKYFYLSSPSGRGKNGKENGYIVLMLNASYSTRIPNSASPLLRPLASVDDRRSAPMHSLYRCDNELYTVSSYCFIPLLEIPSRSTVSKELLGLNKQSRILWW